MSGELRWPAPRPWRLPAPLLSQPRPRAADQGDRARGVSGGVPLRFARSPAAVPRVRAVFDRLPERVHRPEGLAVRGSLRRGDAALGIRARRPADAVLGRHGDRGVGDAAAGQSPHVWAGGRPDRRNLGGEGRRLRQRSHARHRRHVGRHRRRRERSTAHAAPAGHEGRRLPGDGADGRHRHDRRGRRLDRLCRRGRRLPRRPAVRGRRPGAGLLRPRGSRPDGDGRAAAAGPAPTRTVACSAATCSSTSSSRARRCSVWPTRSGCPSARPRSGALQIQKFGMAQAIEVNSVRRGYDPREFTLVAAGGAGPLFACDIALELEIPRVLVPPHPGTIAATGLLATDLQHEFVATERHALKTPRRRAATRALRRARGAGSRAARRGRRRRGPAPAAAPRGLPLRGTGIRGPLRRARREIDDGWVEELKEAFHRAHEAEYGHRFDAEIEIVNIRVVGIGRIAELEPAMAETGWRRRPLGARRRSSARSSSTSTAGPNAGATAVLRTRAAPRGRPDRGPGDHRAVRLDDGRSPRPFGRDRPVRQHRRRLLAARRRGRGALETELATPILMRVIGGAFSAIAKEMAGVLFRMSYSSIIRESGGSRGRDLRRRGQRPRRVRLDAHVHGRDAEDRQERHQAPRRRHPRGRHRSSTTTRTSARRTRPTWRS